MGTKVRAAAYVGDTPFDIEAGRSAGTLTCGVTWGASGRDRLKGADAVFSDWHELVGFFRP